MPGLFDHHLWGSYLNLDFLSFEMEIIKGSCFYVWFSLKYLQGVYEIKVLSKNSKTPFACIIVDLGGADAKAISGREDCSCPGAQTKSITNKHQVELVLKSSPSPFFFLSLFMLIYLCIKCVPMEARRWLQILCSCELTSVSTANWTLVLYSNAPNENMKHWIVLNLSLWVRCPFQYFVWRNQKFSWIASDTFWRIVAILKYACGWVTWWIFQPPFSQTTSFIRNTNPTKQL